MSASPQFAFVTLVTTDQYLPGALVVAAALRDIHPSPPSSAEELDPSEFHIVCLVTPESVDVTTVKLLRKAFDVVIGVELIEESTEEGLKLLGRLDLKTVLTKLHMFRLTSYQKLVYLDADVLPLRPLSHLFRLSADFAAVPDVGWPDIFNSGFLVLKPDTEKFDQVMSVVKSKGSWDGGDQGVLNEWKGNEWERLSFTYNTTPTAAYTYAPAYKRFGSQINNIHFIGPNKPWQHIPVRAPGSSSSDYAFASGTSQDFAPPPSYAYPALLDRWFAVYDKHYRPPPARPVSGAAAVSPVSTTAGITDSKEELVTQRYENVWDSGRRPEVGVSASASSVPLGLEELRRAAIEGVGDSRVTNDEGVYRSLPLEGRIDLMRIQKPVPTTPEIPVAVVTEKPALPVVRIQVSDGPQTPTRSHSPAPMTTLPTPGPNELPPAPIFRGHSLPPETPTHAPHAYHLETRARPVSPLRAVSPPHPTFEHPHRHSSPSHRHPSPLRHARPVSPPLLSWNPAVEAPPSIPPPALHFPEQTYFPNVWDARSQDHYASDEDGGFFPLPPPSNIPERLIKEGHYKAVIGEPVPADQQQCPPLHEQQEKEPHFGDHLDIHQEHPHAAPPPHPHPDRSKISNVFPWEEKPRHAPQRFFPRTDSPPPGQPFIQPQPPALEIDLHPPRAAPLAVVPPPLVPGFPRTTTYANAWDVVPSIQRYASRLVRPSPAPASLVPEWTDGPGRMRRGSAATAGGGEHRDWQDQVEVSSRDADDEDEGDDGEEEASPPSVGAESDRSDGLGQTLQQKTYRMKSVQTISREMRHQGVQVQNGKPSEQPGSKHSFPWPERGAERREQPSLPPQQGRGLPKTISSRAVRPPEFMPRQGALLHDTHTSGPIGLRGEKIPATAPQGKAPTMPMLSPEPPRASAEAAFVPTYSASPPSSLEPSSPPESVSPSQVSQPTVHRPPVRTFDPARGVDVFKRGSEEVLARFLRMDSWDKDSQSSLSTI